MSHPAQNKQTRMAARDQRQPQVIRGIKTVIVNGITWRESEASDLKYKVGQAKDAAKLILNEQRIYDINYDVKGSEDNKRKITLLELNEISSAIVEKNLYLARQRRRQVH